VKGGGERSRRTQADLGARLGRPDITVRRATLDDLETVLELRLALLREYRANRIYRRLRSDARARAREIFAAQLASPDEITLLAQRQGEVVGILRCVDTLGYPLLLPERHGYISSVYVLPEARHSGVLSKLLAEATSWCEARNLTELRLHSTAENAVANSAWEALGFRIGEHLRVRPLP
jgi:ribosomal protein S18 acetylase RimI-like enzyme